MTEHSAYVTTPTPSQPPPYAHFRPNPNQHKNKFVGFSNFLLILLGNDNVRSTWEVIRGSEMEFFVSEGTFVV